MDLKELLGEDLYGQVTEKLGKEKIAIVSDGSYIPKEKFDGVNNDNKQLKIDLKERDTQLVTLGEKAKGNETLTQEIETLKTANKTTKEEYEQKIQKQAFDHTLDKALSGAKVKNTKAVKGLLDLDTIKLDGDTLKGFDDQIKSLKESDDYLFEVEENPEDKKKPTFSKGEHKKVGGDEPASLADALSQHFKK